MSSLQPKSTSTPNIVPYIRGRHSYKDLDIQSPIQPIKKVEADVRKSKSRLKFESARNIYDNRKIVMSEEPKDGVASMIEGPSDSHGSDHEDISTELDDESEIEAKADDTERLTDQRSAESSTSNMFKFYYVPLIILIFVIFVGQAVIQNMPLPTITINTLKKSFPQQDQQFWAFIKTGVMEINNFEKPTVIILMHKQDMTNVSELLSNITTYASCVINNNCLIDPIVLKGKDLNTPELIEDYGILIDTYKLLLEEKRILVVKNLHEVLGSVAQAFHYFCDEYSPLVKKSLIIFTIQVNEYKGKEIEQAVNILNRKWRDIEPDILQPLITRVSSIVLRMK